MIESRFVVLEERNREMFEDVLPKGTTMATAKEKARNAWERLTAYEKQSTYVFLALMDFDTETEMLNYDAYDTFDLF